MKSLSKTPSPKKDRIYGSKVNPKGSASSEKTASSIKFNPKTIASLTTKLKEFKETNDTKKVSLSDLKAVYRRGLGAYSSSHRPTISGGKPNTRNAWAMARVNAFLKKASGGGAKKTYVQDDDLLKFADGGEVGQDIKCRRCGWEWNTKDSEEFDKYVCHNCGFDNRMYYDKNPIGMKDGGEVDEHKETYAKWKSLVNMSATELQKFYNSQEGKDAGLSTSEANEQGISSGRESARWIMKMKNTRVADWTPQMWKWANKQISFISRMSGNKGELYDDKGNKTRKHTSLLIWGHNPKKKSNMKYEDGGITDKYEISDYWDVESFGGGGEVKTKKIISDKVGWNEVFAQYFIDKDPKLAIWLADSLMKGQIEKWDNNPNSEIEWQTYDLKTKKQKISDMFNNVADLDAYGGLNNYSLRTEIRLILDWLKHPLTDKQNLRELSFKDAYLKANQFHKELEAMGGDVDYIEPEENVEIKEYPKLADGTQYYWVQIPKTFCSLESQRMGHCGRTGAGNNLISLRSIRPYGKGHTINESHVTIAYNDKDGIFYQTKGKNNQKPAKKYHQYIFDLVKTLAQKDRRDYISEVQSKIQDLNERKLIIENEQESISNQLVELRSVRYKLEDVLSKVKNNRDYIEVNDRIDEVEATLFKLKRDIDELDFELKRLVAKILKEQDRIEDIEKMYRYGFGGFGAEYGSEEDYGFGEMTDEQVKELYEINPSLFSNLGGRLILFNRGILKEKPDTTFIYESDVEVVSELFKYNGKAKFLYNVITGNLLEDFEYSVDNDEVVKYYLDDLNEKNINYVLEEISRITSIPIEEVRENGAKYYLSGDYYDDEIKYTYNYEFDSIIDAIRRAVTYAMESDSIKYYYKQIKDTLSELGEVLQLDDDKVKVKIDLSNFLTTSQIQSYSQEYGDSLAEILFEANYRHDIDFPRLSFDDNFYPSADAKLINEYFEPDFYEDGGTLPDIRMEDTIARIDDPRLADISYYKKGGKLELNEPILYHEVQGNFFIGKDTIYMWLYDDPNATSKLQSGEYDWVFFQPTSIYQASEKGFVPPLLRQWHKKYQKNMKGSEHLMAILKAWYDEKEKKMYILMMTTHPKFRKKGIMAKMIKDLREEFNLSQDDVIFDKPTNMGKAFMEAKKFDDGGVVEYVLYGTKIGEPDYMEDLLFVDNEEIVINKKLTDWLKLKGYDRVRVSKSDMREKPDFTKAIRKDDGGTINQQINSNIMDEIKFNQLPHIDTIIKGDKILIKESVFTGNIDNPKHIGDRYIYCEILGDSDMVSFLNLKVLNSVGVNPMLRGQKIERPKINLLTKGRKIVTDATSKFKDGGLNPDNKNVKQYFAHDMGNAGGVLVGKRHSEGGIKAINKGTGQPLEMEGGEVVITRGAVSNPKKYKFNGNEMTTREILSKLNVDGGGVSFAEGGDVPEKMNCGCDKMDFGGTTMTTQDFVNRSEKEYEEYRLKIGMGKEKKDHYDTLSKLNAGTITIQEALSEIAKKEMKLDSNYPFAE